jgi:hypothetical protein
MLYKFYRIKSDKGDKVYIGSTTNDLKQRWWNHKFYRNCNSCILFDEYGVDNCIIELISEIDFETKEEARKEEGRLILEAGDNAVNKQIAGRTKREYHKIYSEKNKELICAKAKIAYEKNKEKILAKQKIAREKNREKENMRLKQFYEKNKEKILAKAKIAYQKKKLTLQ